MDRLLSTSGGLPHYVPQYVLHKRVPTEQTTLGFLLGQGEGSAMQPRTSHSNNSSTLHCFGPPESLVERSGSTPFVVKSSGNSKMKTNVRLGGWWF